MRKFGLIGYPLGHSFSKKYFTEKFLNEHIDGCSYENFPLEDILQLHTLIYADLLLEGLNVTIPYKTAILPILDEIEQEAADVGAVNVIKIKRRPEKAILYGFNSDVTGIRESLFPLLKPEMTKALVFGSGGASKAICYVLDKISVKYTLISRNKRPGYLTYSDIDKKLLENTQLIINTTPLGMYPDINSKPEIDYSLLDERHLLFDLVYNPEMTVFLKKGQERGCIVINGMKMLISQAERSWEIWNDESF